MDAMWRFRLKVPFASMSQSPFVRSKMKPLRVLIVDENEKVSETLMGLVRCWGHASYLACDGSSVMRLAAIRQPNVVILNMEMIRMDGWQIAKDIRQTFSRDECFIIAITAREDAVRQQQRVKAGVDLMLSKPVDQEVLETLLMLEHALVNRQTGNRLGETVPCWFNFHKWHRGLRNGTPCVPLADGHY